MVVPVEPAPVVPVRLPGVALGEVPLLVFLPARLVQGDDEYPLAWRHRLDITDTPGWRQAACRKAERVGAGQPQFAIQGADVAGPVLAEVLVVQLPQLAEPWSRHHGIIRERIGCARRSAGGGCLGCVGHRRVRARRRGATGVASARRTPRTAPPMRQHLSLLGARTGQFSVTLVLKTEQPVPQRVSRDHLAPRPARALGRTRARPR